MIKIMSKEHNNITFNNSNSDFIVFSLEYGPIEIHGKLNFAEIMRQGILQIDRKAYTFDTIYINIHGKDDVKLFAEELVEIIERPKDINFTSKEIFKKNAEIKSLELLMEQELYNYNNIEKVNKIRKELVLNKYLKWKGNIWR